MKKCQNCTHLTIFNECSYNVIYEIVEDNFIGKKQVRSGNFEPIFKMRSEKGQCGLDAKLYNSKYTHMFLNLSILALGGLITFYIFKEMVLFLDGL